MSETSLMKVGVVGVDSGRIMLLDPCYEGKVRINEIATDLGIADVRHVESAVNIGVVAQTGVGDGLFPVIAELVDGKLNGILLDFGDDDLEKGILGARMIARGEEAPEIVGPVEPPPPDGWQGTPPAEGTRRKLILDVLEDFSLRLISGAGGKATEGSCLGAADAIEEALLRVVDQGATPESGSPASVAMDVLDGLGVGRTRDGAILTIADRVNVVAGELVERRREAVRSGEKLDEISIPRTSADAGGSEGATTLTLNERVYLAVKRVLVEEEAKRLLANTVNAQQSAMDKLRAEGEVKPGTRELVIVLEDVSDAEHPPEYRFIELEDQDGAGVGSFPMQPSSRKPFLEITIPYGRDDGWDAP